MTTSSKEKQVLQSFWTPQFKGMLKWLSIVGIVAFVWISCGRNSSETVSTSISSVDTLPPLKPIQRPQSVALVRNPLKGTREKLFNNLEKNTMGSHKLPKEISDKVIKAIDSLFLLQELRLYNSFKNAKLDIARVDTIQSFQLNDYIDGS